ncbi:MarR family winged helix-turn-helix transcriptional regulator [Sciscionella marina]|uniref:MarR family winged helix-turn-helix transcriptional regulator n=1 Tax=Sciscionella marina TaxID=508770 RepID=UPI00035E0758|nr:MarR family transcriptional regulator [Sciscionella marina]
MNEQALALIDLLYRLNRSIVDDAREHVSAVANLEIGEFVLLRAITAGTTSPGELSRALSNHPAATSRTLTQLVRAGLIDRRPDRRDSRRTEVVLTEQGRTVTEQIAAHIRPRLQHRLDQLDPAEAARLIETLERLLGTDS